MAIRAADHRARLRQAASHRLRFAEFAAALESAEVIEEHVLADDQLKELVLVIVWARALHVVVVVDARHHEERIVTIYEPDPLGGTTSIVGGADALRTL